MSSSLLPDCNIGQESLHNNRDPTRFIRRVAAKAKSTTGKFRLTDYSISVNERQRAGRD
ncbi:hypothetical protein J6590_009172 [Homalodisca vitripennis]|nr:hypothetical protein J6590_009172 [Homalodisca vitripennis]